MKKLARGTAKLDMKKLGADFGYTMDGGEAGSLKMKLLVPMLQRLSLMGLLRIRVMQKINW